MKIRHGTTRIVLVFKRFVVKIPNFIFSHNNFLQGCVANWRERNFYKNFKGCYVGEWGADLTDFVSPSYYCSIFGLFQIQAKCEPLLRDLTKFEEKTFKSVCGGDFKKENFGYHKGVLVCLDFP